MAQNESIPADAIEVRKAFDLACQCVLLSLVDLKPENAIARLGETTNPVIWQVGHLAHQQNVSLHQTNGGERFLPEEIGRWFAWGSNPADDLDDYPSFGTVVDCFISVTLASGRLLDKATAEDWHSPRTAPDGKLFAGGETLVEIVRRMTLHYMYHVGCITVIRKELGNKCPVGFVPGLTDEWIARQQAQWDEFWKTHRSDYL